MTPDTHKYNCNPNLTYDVPTDAIEASSVND